MRQSIGTVAGLLLMVPFSAGIANATEPEEVMLADFEKDSEGWTSQAHSSLSVDSGAAHSGKWGLVWVMRSDGVEPYGNCIILSVKVNDWSKYSSLLLDFFPTGEVYGRIGCQVISGEETLSLPDISPEVSKGEWKTVELPLPSDGLTDVTELRLFCNAREYPRGAHKFYIDNIRLKKSGDGIKTEKPKETERLPEIRGEPLPLFSGLKPAQQATIHQAVAPPPLAKRRNPYSTPMYFPMWGSSSPDGKLHADWQEALVKEWAELGMTKLHYYVYPNGNGTENRSYTIDLDFRAGNKMFVDLCRKHGLKIGLRVDLPCTLDKSGPGVEPATDYWIAHPNNPNNELKPYFDWLSNLVTLMKGNVEYIILGDEIDWKKEGGDRAWNAEIYMKFFTEAARVIHQADPAVKVSMYGASSGRWNEVLGLLKAGYAKHGDAIAINHYDYTVLNGYKNDLKKYSPDKKLLLLSNGVGYISSDTKDRNPSTDPYSRYDDLGQAAMIARTMLAWWDVDADVAPYYICMRNIAYQGKAHPCWYGFFGFMDLVIDDQDHASIRRYPGWYAYQTVAQVFHDRAAFRDPSFTVEADDGGVQFLKAYERANQELLIVVWGKSRNSKTNLRINTTRYAYPIRVDLLDYQNWHAIPAIRGGDVTVLQDVPISMEPTIIRLVSPEVLSTSGGKTRKN